MADSSLKIELARIFEGTDPNQVKNPIPIHPADITHTVTDVEDEKVQKRVAHTDTAQKVFVGERIQSLVTLTNDSQDVLRNIVLKVFIISAKSRADKASSVLFDNSAMPIRQLDPGQNHHEVMVLIVLDDFTEYVLQCDTSFLDESGRDTMSTVTQTIHKDFVPIYHGFAVPDCDSSISREVVTCRSISEEYYGWWRHYPRGGTEETIERCLRQDVESLFTRFSKR